eukprot:TRINITY_DN11291_c0_g1_i19.p1 TRINITY_DN11291_c0_g1~~TRINITY_DN11291_c0_g1_i19.p1  ORF type:complete len:613 (-),score=75.40 TRINITY_DN11291_c0_g1_i19:25-1863(-)
MVFLSTTVSGRDNLTKSDFQNYFFLVFKLCFMMFVYLFFQVTMTKRPRDDFEKFSGDENHGDEGYYEDLRRNGQPLPNHWLDDDDDANAYTSTTTTTAAPAPRYTPEEEMMSRMLASPVFQTYTANLVTQATLPLRRELEIARKRVDELANPFTGTAAPLECPTPLRVPTPVGTPTVRTPTARTPAPSTARQPTPFRPRALLTDGFDHIVDLDDEPEGPAEQMFDKKGRPLPKIYTAEAPKPTTARKEVQCDGTTCFGYGCILVTRWVKDVDAAKWFYDHGFSHQACRLHGTTKIDKNGKCRVPVDLKGGYCRRNCHQTPDPRMFRVLHMLAHFSPIAVMQEALGVDRNIIGRLVKSMAKAALWDQNNNRPKYSMFAVDETCIGKRLYEQGARTRVAQFWFFTATGINRDGTAISTTWYGTHARNAENAEAFIKSCMAGTRCTIYTDGHKCYYHIGDFCKKHGVVNHSEGFKNDAGEHTNHAEGAHGVVKDIVRAIWTNFGQTGPLVEERAALGAFLFNKGGGHRTRVKQTRARMVALLELFQRCHPATPTYVFEEGPTEPLPGEDVAEGDVDVAGDPEDVEEEEDVPQGRGQAEVEAVSYTHLTLPTKRIV